MAKKASKSQKSRSSASSSSSKRVSKEGGMVLRIRSNEITKRPTRRQSVVSIEKERRLKSAMKPKTNVKQKAKKNQKFDAKKPKKPPTAFFYFLTFLVLWMLVVVATPSLSMLTMLTRLCGAISKEDFRKEFQEKNPDVKSMREVGKACGEKWKTMTYEEKVKYYDIATEKRAAFDGAMAEYIKRKESGEDEDSEDASEFDE